MKMTEIVVRTVCESDLKAICDIENQCFSFPHTMEQMKNELNDSCCVILCADVDGCLAGYITMRYVLDEGYIGNVAVRYDQRRKGIADRLVSEMTAKVHRLDLAFLTLEVRESNEPAISLYKKNRFEICGIQKNYYTKPKDNAIIMTLMFEKLEGTQK